MSSKELKDEYPLDQNYFETEEAFLFGNEYEATSNFEFTKTCPNTNKGKVKFV